MASDQCKGLAAAVIAVGFAFAQVGCSSSTLGSKPSSGGSPTGGSGPSGSAPAGPTTFPPLTPGTTSGPSTVKVVLEGQSTELHGTGSCKVTHIQDPELGELDSLVYNLLPAEPMMQAEVYLNRRPSGSADVGAVRAILNSTERIYFAPGFSPNDPSDATATKTDAGYKISGHITVLSMDFNPTTLKQHAPFELEFSCP
jgi:hypothetical protein